VRRLRGSWHRGETSTQLSATMVTCAVRDAICSHRAATLIFSGNWHTVVSPPVHTTKTT
jgi:hypothetical protein